MKTFYESELKELAGKRFESVKELEKAEAEVSEKIAAKQKAAELRKSDSDVVKAAIVSCAETKKKVKEAKIEAYKNYLKTIDELEKKEQEAVDAQDKAFSDFCKKYPDGFHDTVTIDDVTYRYDYSTNSTGTRDLSLFDVFDNLFRF